MYTQTTDVQILIKVNLGAYVSSYNIITII
jgi:hypothetical protein